MKGIWIKLLGRVVALSFVLSLIAINSVAGQEKLKFPVSASSKTLGYSPLWVAHRQRFFDQQGLDVQLVLVSGADKSTMALMGGSVFASSGAIDAIIGATEQGADLVSLGGVINGLTHALMAGKNSRPMKICAALISVRPVLPRAPHLYSGE
jgi:ABC-type nitrate/sulfonate/bicarbonate transport system substrate-binding protein